MAVVYSRRIDSPTASSQTATSRVARDTVVFTTAVLYSLNRDRTWSAEWAGTVEREVTRSIDIQSAERGDHSLLVAFRYCVNGTGGC